MLCDENVRARVREHGEDPKRLLGSVHRRRQPHSRRSAAEYDDCECICAAVIARPMDGRRRLRRDRGSPVQRARTSTVSSSSTTRRAPAISHRCASCPRTSSCVSGSSARRLRRWKTKTPLKRRIDEAADLRAARASRASRRNAVSPAPSAATRCRSKMKKPSCAWSSKSLAKSGTELGRPQYREDFTCG